MKNPSKPRINHNNITNQVHDQLRQGILKSRFPVGEKINVYRLSLEWDVSKTPIREALRALGKEGLVRYLPRKGYFVLALDYEEIKDIIELRMVLETYALRKGFDRIDRERMRKLSAMFEDSYEGFNKGDENRYLNTDYQFHLEIIRSAGNKRIAEMYESLKGSTDLLRLAHGEEVGKSMPEHRLVIKAILNNDLETALEGLKAVFDKIQGFFVKAYPRQ